MTDLKKVLETIRDAGGKPLFVGGYVRDTLLGRDSKDIDVEVFGMPMEKLEEVLSTFGTVDLVGKSFGVLKLHHLQDVDFSLPRKDNNTGAGHQDFAVEVDHTMDFFSACRRRDLTVNAMGMDPFTEKVIDTVDGIKHLERGELQEVDRDRFLEDPLRALRVARFISQLDFRPKGNLYALCRDAHLAPLSVERIYEEMSKLLLGVNPMAGLSFMDKTSMTRFFPPIVEKMMTTPQAPKWHAEGDVWTHTKMVVQQSAKYRTGDRKRDLILAWACFCHDFGKPDATFYDFNARRWKAHGHDRKGVRFATEFLTAYSAPGWLIKAVEPLVATHLTPFEFIRQKAGDGAYRRLARRMGGVSMLLLADLAKCDGDGRMSGDPEQQKPEDVDEFIKKAVELGVTGGPAEDAVRGEHLFARGLKPGTKFGEILAKCRSLQDNTGWTDPDKILKQVGV